MLSVAKKAWDKVPDILVCNHCNCKIKEEYKNSNHPYPVIDENLYREYFFNHEMGDIYPNYTPVTEITYLEKYVICPICGKFNTITIEKFENTNFYMENSFLNLYGVHEKLKFEKEI